MRREIFAVVAVGTIAAACASSGSTGSTNGGGTPAAAASVQPSATAPRSGGIVITAEQIAKTNARDTHTATQIPASLGRTACAFRWKTPRSSASIARTNAMNPIHNQTLNCATRDACILVSLVSCEPCRSRTNGGIALGRSQRDNFPRLAVS